LFNDKRNLFSVQLHYPAWFHSVNVDGTHSVRWQGLCSSTTQSTLQQLSTMHKVSEGRIDILDILKLTVIEAHCIETSCNVRHSLSWKSLAIENSDFHAADR